MFEVWSWLAEVVLTRRSVEGLVKAESVEEWCFSSRDTIFEDGNATAEAELAGFVDAAAREKHVNEWCLSRA
jgi:hypothetical protein